MIAFSLGFLCVTGFLILVAVWSVVDHLRAIRDTLAGKGPSILTAPINSYGEGIGDAIQGQLIRGQRGVDQYEGR